MKQGIWLLTVLFLAKISVTGTGRAQAQSVIPAPDGTGTLVTPNGNQFDISGGQLSKDGANLFHSLTQLNLSQEQIANFLSNPRIQNILGRIVGGDASLIDGLLRVSGGTSNLYLMNPAGIVFGPNARLDLPGSFTATTANGIGFGSNWFNALGPSNYAELVGIPSTFAFTMAQPGSIINTGNLTVASGQNLSLLGGTVVSTGQLSAPQGQIIVSSVPGTSAIRVRPVGQLLSYEIQPSEAFGNQPTPWTLPISSLAELLTGKSSEPKPQVAPGDVAVQQVTGQTATISAAQNLNLVESQLNTTGDLTLTAQNTVLVRDSVTNPFIAHAQGNLYIQGNQGIDILALNHPITPFQSGGNLSLVSNGIISGDSHFASGGNFSIRTLSGVPGTFVSFYDPIISSNGDVSFGDYTGVALKVEATGSISGGNVRITGPDTSLSGSDPDIPTLTSSPALILRAGLTALANSPNVPQTQQSTTFTSPGGPSPNGSITVGNIDTSSSTGNGGSVLLNAAGNLEIKNVNTGTGGDAPTVTVSSATNSVSISASSGSSSGTGSGGNISLTSSNGNISTGSLLSFASSGGGTVQVDAFDNVALGEVNSSVTSNGNPGSISITARTGNISTGNLFAIASLSNPGNGAPIQLSSGSNVATGNISTLGTNGGNGGTVQILATGNISTGNISTGGSVFSGASGVGNGGDVVLRANPGNISVGTLYLSSGGNSGNVDISATGGVAVGNIFTLSTAGTDGAVKLAGSNVSQGQVNFGFTSALTIASAPKSSQSSAPRSLEGVPTDVPYSERPAASPNETVQFVEQARREEFQEYFNRKFPENFKTSESRQFALATIERQIEKKPATIYASYTSEAKDQLELILETSDGAFVQYISTVERIGQREIRLTDAIEALQETVSNPNSKDAYKEPAKQVYQWLIKPLEAELKRRDVKLLLFSMGKGLRFIPLAALMDDRDQFLIQNYSIGLIPSLDLLKIDLFGYSEVNNFQVLPVGSSRFEEPNTLSSLAGVPLELSIIKQRSGSTQLFLNQDLSLQNLDELRTKRPFRIIHLATHASFKKGDANNSYIQLSPNKKFTLKDMAALSWNNAVDLLVLSACKTEFGVDSKDAELSFAGVSAQIGVRSTLASLWEVSDVGTVVLMNEFYNRLLKLRSTQPTLIKAEALRQAQIAMLGGTVQTEQLKLLQKEVNDLLTKGQEQRNLSGEEAGYLLLLKAFLSDLQNSPLVKDLQHPFYWAGFTLVGTPW